MRQKKIRQLIEKAAKTIYNEIEFDAKMIEEIIFEQYQEILSHITIGRHLPKMHFKRRRLTEIERYHWMQQNDIKPKYVYSRHLGRNARDYERGIGTRKSRPNLSELQERGLDIEECSKCPEWKECKGTLRPCPRFPVQAIAPKNRVYRLEDFE